MRQVFLDTSYLFAAFDPDDDLHERALAISDDLINAGVQFVSTQSMLVEFLTLVRKMGPRHRIGGVGIVQALKANPRVSFADESTDLFNEALDLYQSRKDKTYSMADCLGMVVCRGKSISEVLTHDKDFVQEGFVALLRNVTS